MGGLEKSQQNQARIPCRAGHPALFWSKPSSSPHLHQGTCNGSRYFQVLQKAHTVPGSRWRFHDQMVAPKFLCFQTAATEIGRFFSGIRPPDYPFSTILRPQLLLTDPKIFLKARALVKIFQKRLKTLFWPFLKKSNEAQKFRSRKS